jgi:predicted transcriptional regulator
MASVKVAAQEVLNGMSDDMTWEDLMYQLYVREKIEIGLQQMEAGEVFDDEEVFQELLDDVE